VLLQSVTTIDDSDEQAVQVVEEVVPRSDIQQLRLDISSITGAKTADGLLLVLSARSAFEVTCSVCPKSGGDAFSIHRSISRPGAFLRAIQEHCAGVMHLTRLAELSVTAPARNRLSFPILSAPSSFSAISGTSVTVVCSGYNPSASVSIPISFTVDDVNWTGGKKTVVTIQADPLLLLGNTFWPARRNWAADLFCGSLRHR
jgi:hypothetical protein